MSNRSFAHHAVLLSDLREVLEASTVTLAPDRNWKAKLFPSLSSDLAENSAERETDTVRDSSEMRLIGQPIMMQDANKKVNKIQSHRSQRHTQCKQAGAYTNPSTHTHTLTQHEHKVCLDVTDADCS